MSNSSTSSQVQLIEIAQQCNVSVRDIHFAAKELKTELAPTARTVDSKFAKLLVKYFVDKHEQDEKEFKAKEKKEKAEKAKAVKEAKQAETKLKEVVAETSKPVIETAQVKKPKSSYEILPKAEPLKKIIPKEKFKTQRPSNQEKKPQAKVVERAKQEMQKFQDIGRRFKPEYEKRDEKPRDSKISDELLGMDEDNKPKDTAQLYDEIIAEEREREIIHSQRKKMAGREVSKASIKKAANTSHTIKYDPDRIIEVPDVISVKEFAEKSGLGAARIVGELMKNGILANINQMIDYDTVSIIADDLKVKVRKKITEASAEDIYKGNLSSLIEEHDKSLLQSRPPIVVVMGHVDHGKTKLLDAIRHTDVVSGEAGGITQHIGAYQVEKNGRKITFIDTPGHEAFTAMRARGAKVTDIAVLVVAADEGVKPQTLEALQHAKDAQVPIIVAINKIDKPNADIERIKGELASHELIPEEWGGKTIMVPVSALTGKGVDTLLEMILLTADMAEVRANANRTAVATVIEAHLDPSLGPVATIIVNTGTLKIMDNVVVGESYGRIKLLKDHHGKNLKNAGPSTPVLIAGLDARVASGDILQVVSDERTAREKSIAVKSLSVAHQKERGVGQIMSAISSGKLKTLKLILKADTSGSLEAIKHSLTEIKNEDVGVRVILSGVGDVSESDVLMAAASGGIVMAFNCDVNSNVRNLAERENVEVIKYNIIYKLLDDVKKILSGLLEPEFLEVILGELEAKAIFYSKRKEMVVGCFVNSGKVEDKSKFRIKRSGEVVAEGQIVSLQKNQDSVKEVKEGSECGIKVNTSVKVEVGDILEIFKIEKKIRTL